MELDTPPCLSLPRRRRTKCSKCKPGKMHGHIRSVFLQGREAACEINDIFFEYDLEV
jgi:hypothetical protein